MSSIFHYLRLDTFIYLYSRDIVARDHMVVGFTTTYAISAYCNWCCGFDSRSGQGVQHCDQVCQWFAAGRWFSPGILVSSTNKTYCHDITEILLKVALNTIKKNNLPLHEMQTILWCPSNVVQKYHLKVSEAWNIGHHEKCIAEVIK